MKKIKHTTNLIKGDERTHTVARTEIQTKTGLLMP